MQVILLDKVANLGSLGDQVNVKAGYARNFLVPQGKAVPATKKNIEFFEARRAELEAKLAEVLAAANARAEKINALETVTIASKAGDEGKLFGSVIPISGDIPLINVLLVDDHELVRAGIRRILEDIKGIKVVGEASCGEDAVKWCRTNAVDVVLMDMSMPGIGGLEATRKIARSTADVKIIMLTVHTENPLPAKVMQAGAAGYLSKGAAPQEVVSAIRSVYSGQRYIASDIAQQMALSQIEPEKTESPFASLSERELQIMLMITKGQKVNEISEQLNLSPKTVNSYRYRMFSKLNIHGDVELTHLAIRHGLCNAETLSSQ